MFIGQDGDGFGDMLRGLLSKAIPFLFPVVKGALSTFMDTAQQGMAEGKSAKEILKSTIKPTFTSAISSIGEEIKNRTQTGSGRKRRRVQRKKRRVYKQLNKKVRQGVKRRRKIRKIDFNPNF